jgi:Eco57I restriction-modification methylase
MIPGLAGSLLSHDALSRSIPDRLRGLLDESGCAAAQRRVQALQAKATAELGPACGPRLVFDRLAAPLAAELGFRVTLCDNDVGDLLRARLHAGGTIAAALIVTVWGRDPSALWRDGVRHGMACGVRWCYCLTGPQLRLLDARRTYSRRFLEFDLTTAVADARGFSVLWGLLRADAFVVPTSGSAEPLLDRAVVLSEHHRTEVRASLQQGVHDALLHLVRAFASAGGRRRMPASYAPMFDESLIVVYRVLFLLFAEARGLVPRWHPTYRDSYTIESLRTPVECVPRPRGLWESLQAIARLAHRGCRAGALRVPPFNGRLFSPADAPLADSVPLDDGAVRLALLALTTRSGRSGRERIAYADLGVEQLGGVYERVLDFEPAAPGGDIRQLTLVPADRRKATGSYYTPRTLTEYLVRRTLAPLVHEATPEEVLSLRVLDPAMGSGAFLVAACRYLSAAYEAALVKAGVVAATDIDERARANFRRTVAQRCLFGVDVNPMAVQLGRLSLWLATLAGDRPLTFLDHHLRSGNSLAGASLEDVARQPPPSGARRVRTAHLPLFESATIDRAIGATVAPRLSIACDGGDTIEQVRGKERLLATLLCDDAPLARWKAVADLWCAGWFRDTPGPAGPFAALVDAIIGRGAVLPGHVSGPLVAEARTIAERERFFHWTLEFPEVFYDQNGRVMDAPGFDAVIGNPPWEMLRAHRGNPAARRTWGETPSRLTAFARTSGVYAHQGDGHANLYQLFLERALSLARTGGRLGMVLPSGFASDYGCAQLRRHVLDRSAVDTLVSIENRDGLFPIHRGLRFLLMTSTVGAATAALRCRFGVRSPDVLDELPDLGVDPGALTVSRELIVRLTGDQLAIPDLRTPADLSIAAKIASTIPALGDTAGWNVAFGRELNATDDRQHFIAAEPGANLVSRDSRHGRGGDRRLPVIEGKQVRPFLVDAAASRFYIPERVAATLLCGEGTFRRARLAYRDVAASTNRLTLIAAVLPPGVVTTHTLFCLKDAIGDVAQQFLCGVFNSFVANYLVRLRVGMHVTVSIVERLPVPRPSSDLPAFQQIARLSRALAQWPDDRDAAAAIQAHVAQLYGVTPAEFQYVLDSFPLVATDERVAAMRAFLLLAN